MILCKTADVVKEPKKRSYFQALMGSSYPGLDHFWRELSYNQMNLTGSAVFGWYPLPHTIEEYLANPDLSSYDDCMAAADPDIYFPDYFGIINVDADGTTAAAGIGGTATYTRDAGPPPTRRRFRRPTASSARGQRFVNDFSNYSS